ncbi:RagB/SusD family nutrient uptake outer membrane protein [Chitinophaga japonensis]|uniref:SusD-like starch-binding protein associating with outer membrane n=1 Tax=Chitinophaga japonensis TaxID=104662 RepID=A0A562T0I9_CHIJA|nr:RagB/SusD family nutrient uptake outer membrane protein [Chitinophaga japonensis]TWI86873.1 SusD-like starch-binding protein associating with outer membrane [Chitinophaga japonensis]
MTIRNIKTSFSILAVLYAFMACKSQLDINDPNQPSPGSSATESGILSLGQGVYASGFYDMKYYDGVIGRFWSGAVGFHEQMGDVIGMEAANEYMNQLGCPDKVILDDGTVVLSPGFPPKQLALIRAINNNGEAGNNPLIYEWAYMYQMNKTCNYVLSVLDQVNFSGDAATKKAVVRAWAYWWKGYAYSRIGSMYYAGIVNDDLNVAEEPTATNGNYLSKEAMIAAANARLDTAAAILGTLSANADYTATLGKLIPSFFQVGKGGALTPDAWIRNINTLKARNLLVNTTVEAMPASRWDSILTLANNGIRRNDLVFTGRSDQLGDLIAAANGTVAARATSSSPGGGGYKISERLVQDYKPGDQRLANNFVEGTTWIGNTDRGNSFNTKHALVDGGKGLAGVIVYSNRDVGATELYLAGTWEENELMKAEAAMYLGNFSPASILTGMALIDEVRSYQGAGLPPTVALTAAEAKEELRRERRVGLVFRALSFYDARRWKVIDPVAQGGGRSGCVVIDNAGNINTNATIEYGFLDYWDVPDNELASNPPAAGSAAVMNPRTE